MNPFVIAFRRIIYSIPLKRLLLGLAVFGVLFASFSNATTIIPDYSDGDFVFSHKRGSSSATDLSPNQRGITCVEIDDYSNSNYYLDDGINRYYFNTDWAIYCTDSMNITVFINSNYYYRFFFSEDFVKQFFPNYTSLQCQTEYNLIPVESVDQNYCTSNNLCPASSPSDCPNVGVSNLYINDLFHPGAFNIIMNIPEEIDWDYTYTNSGQNFNLDVVGYNQDFEKIEGWIETNNYKPSSNDFTKLFTGGFSKFGGLLIAGLFVILVFYFVKKMFK